MIAEERKVFEALIEDKGRDHQQVVAIGELAELSSEIAKMLRGNGSEWKLIDEIADVGIVLDQLRLMYDPDGSKEALYREFKICRAQLRNLEGGQP